MDYQAYKHLDVQIDALYEGRHYDQALALISRGIERFPERAVELDNYRLVCHRELGDFERCLTLLNEGIARGQCYGLDWKRWDSFRSHPGYADMERRNRSNRDLTQIDSLPQFKIVTPPDHDAACPCPLAIVLHGDGNSCNIDTMVQEWSAEPYLKRGFIVCYMQSSRVECTNGFGWTKNYPRSRSEIHGMLRKLAAQCLIDEDHVVIGGFSGGSMASLDILFSGCFPLKGVIALSPARTGTENEAALSHAARAGTRVVLLEGETCGEVEDQVALMAMLRAADLGHRFIQNAGIGHAIPIDMEQRIEEALEFILTSDHQGHGAKKP